MTRLLAVSALTSLALAVGLVGTPARAGEATSTLTVTADVLGACTIAPATLAFGDYDPATGKDEIGTITLQCTHGSVYSIDLDLGSNASGGIRRMAGGTGEFLEYELHRNNLRNDHWTTTGNPTATATTVAAGFSEYTATVYGRIPAGQTVSTGAYADTVAMTVNF